MNAAGSKKRTPSPLRPTAIAASVAACFALIPPAAMANPTGPSVAAGSASFSSAGNALTITNSANAIINWQSFSIGVNEITRFLQSSAGSAVLNRVVGAGGAIPQSVIDGLLQSNGHVFLINPSGIIFGAGARIDVAGLVASSLNLGNEDFLAGRMRFQETPGAGSVSNFGEITAASGGRVFMVGPEVTNGGIIRTPQGETVLAAGKSVELVSEGSPYVTVRVNASNEQAVNIGSLVADSGKIGMYGALVRNAGVVEAGGAVVGPGGRIRLVATRDLELEAGSRVSANGASGGTVTLQAAGGTNLVAGAVEARGSAGKGGEIQALGLRVGVVGNGVIDASGETGGGTVLVGGDYQGRNADVQNAEKTYIGADGVIRADAGATGDGGRVIVWADGDTRFFGSISARGGAQSGNGGFVETSGKNTLQAFGRVNVGAANGQGGNWLLDPTDVTIVGYYGSLGSTCSSSTVCWDDTGGSTIGLNLIEAALAAYGGGTIEVQAENDITIDGSVPATLTFTSQGGTIKLKAGNNIDLGSHNISTNGTSIEATADADFSSYNSGPASNGVGSILSASGYGNVATNGGNITAYGASVTLGNLDTRGSESAYGGGSIAAAATNYAYGGSVTLGNLTTRGGMVSVQAPGNITTGAIDTHSEHQYYSGGSVTLDSTGGAVHVSGAILTYGAGSSGPGYYSGSGGGEVTISGASVRIDGQIDARGGHGADASSYSGGSGGNGGSVTLRADTGDVAVYGAITTSGGNGGRGADGGEGGWGGSAGAVDIAAYGGSVEIGTITAHGGAGGRGGDRVSYSDGEGGSGGNGGIVQISAGGELVSGDIDTRGGAAGDGGAHGGSGGINGRLTDGYTTVDLGNAGAVTLTAGGNLQVGAIAASGGAGGRGGDGDGSSIRGGAGSAGGIGGEVHITTSGTLTVAGAIDTRGGIAGDGGAYGGDGGGWDLAGGEIGSSDWCGWQMDAAGNAGAVTLQAGSVLSFTTIDARGGAGGRGGDGLGWGSAGQGGGGGDGGTVLVSVSEGTVGAFTSIRNEGGRGGNGGNGDGSHSGGSAGSGGAAASVTIHGATILGSIAVGAGAAGTPGQYADPEAGSASAGSTDEAWMAIHAPGDLVIAGDLSTTNSPQAYGGEEQDEIDLHAGGSIAQQSGRIVTNNLWLAEASGSVTLNSPTNAIGWVDAGTFNVDGNVEEGISASLALTSSIPTALGGVSVSGDLAVRADQISFDDVRVPNENWFSWSPLNNSVNLSIDSGFFNRLKAEKVRIGGDGFAGSISLLNHIDLTAVIHHVDTLSLVTSGAIEQISTEIEGEDSLYVDNLNIDGGSVSFTHANRIGTLQGRARSGGFLLNNSAQFGALNVGAVDTAFTPAGISSPASVTITTGGSLQQTAGAGAISTPVLDVTATSVSLLDANQAGSVRGAATNGGFTYVGAGGFDIGSVSASNYYGTAPLSFSGGGTITQSAPLLMSAGQTLSVSTSAGDIRLDNAGNRITKLDSAHAAGDLTVVNGAAGTFMEVGSADGTNVNLVSDQLLVSGSVSASGTIGYSTAGGGTFGVLDSFFNNLHAPSLRLGNASMTGDIALIGPVDLTAKSIGTLSVLTGGTIYQSDPNAGLRGESLQLDGGAVSFAGANQVANLGGRASAGVFEFDNAGALNLTGVSAATLANLRAHGNLNSNVSGAYAVSAPIVFLDAIGGAIGTPAAPLEVGAAGFAAAADRGLYVNTNRYSPTLVTVLGLDNYQSGNLQLNAWGGAKTTTLVTNPGGDVNIRTFSPLDIGAGIAAGGNISLATGGSAPNNMALNGPFTYAPGGSFSVSVGSPGLLIKGGSFVGTITQQTGGSGTDAILSMPAVNQAVTITIKENDKSVVFEVVPASTQEESDKDRKLKLRKEAAKCA